MARIRLPRLPVERPAPPTVEPPPVRTTMLLLGRREFLKLAGALAAAATLPWTRAERSWAAARGRYFTRHEFATLEALCDRVIPPDHGPGARVMGAARYIETLLTAFDGAGTPPIFAGGPFSGRTPFPDFERGRPSHRRPPDAFKHFVPLSRLQELRWRAELFGSAAVPGADFNDATLGPFVGLRQIYRDGLAHVDAVASGVGGRTFVRLSPDDRDAVLKKLDTEPPDPRRNANFLEIVVEHTLEGCFSAPEYGGNRRQLGWKLVGLEGDSQPLGYSLFAKQDDRYHEIRRHPLSTPNPDELVHGKLRPHPISAVGANVQQKIASLAKPFEAC